MVGSWRLLAVLPWLLAASSTREATDHTQNQRCLLQVPAGGSRQSLLVQEDGQAGGPNAQIGEALADLTRVLAVPSGSAPKEVAFISRLSRLVGTPAVRQLSLEMRKVVATLIEVLDNNTGNDTLLLDDHNSRFTELNARINSSKQRAERFAADAETKRRDHKSCRQVQSNLLPDLELCHAQLAALVERRRAVAVTLLGKGLAAGGDKGQNPICNTALKMTDGGDLVAAEFDALQNTFEEYKAAADQFVAARAAVSAKTVLCQNGNSSYEGQKTLCDDKQKDLETAVCAHRLQASSDCSTHGITFEFILSDLRSLRAAVRAKIAHRKIEYTSLKRIDCALQELGALPDNVTDRTDVTDRLHACSSKTTNTSHLEIDMGPLPVMGGCPAVPLLPCSAIYRIAEYKDLPSGTEARACQPCSSPAPPTPAPTPAPPTHAPPTPVPTPAPRVVAWNIGSVTSSSPHSSCCHCNRSIDILITPTSSGTRLRLRFNGADSLYLLREINIAQQDTSRRQPATKGPLVPVSFGGKSGRAAIHIPPRKQVWSDWVSASFPANEPLLVHFYHICGPDYFVSWRTSSVHAWDNGHGKKYIYDVDAIEVE